MRLFVVKFACVSCNSPIVPYAMRVRSLRPFLRVPFFGMALEGAQSPSEVRCLLCPSVTELCEEAATGSELKLRNWVS